VDRSLGEYLQSTPVWNRKQFVLIERKVEVDSTVSIDTRHIDTDPVSSVSPTCSREDSVPMVLWLEYIARRFEIKFTDKQIGGRVTTRDPIPYYAANCLFVDQGDLLSKAQVIHYGRRKVGSQKFLPTPRNKASSPESVGEFWLGEVSQTVI